ncbi:hypothetical protein [Thermodesulfovibrio yellowstonii]|uniref:hypothetical protein n=1 Tax=Thermodesulfovibrio yellowstonii TaxID=28262 RepID=UPI0024B3C613|nr:hypothetical protein [Thermodesulfovibrio yellowstonii]
MLKVKCGRCGFIHEVNLFAMVGSDFKCYNCRAMAGINDDLEDIKGAIDLLRRIRNADWQLSITLKTKEVR